jgi:hypothetical protein
VFTQIITFLLALQAQQAFLIVTPSTTPQQSNTMGIAASIFQKDDDGSSPPPVTTTEEKPKSKKIDPNKAEWYRVCDQFTASILDESYLHRPIRGSTVNASALYPSDFPDRPGLMPGSHKHLGGAYDSTDGCIYGVPANSKSILCIYQDEKDGEYKMKAIPLPKRIVSRQMK